MSVYYESPQVTLLEGDVREQLRTLPDESVNCVVTSPPYWALRDYGVAGQLGLEETPDQFVETMTAVFREVRRVLRKDGTLWLNIGDSYAGSWGAQSRGANDNGSSTLEGSLSKTQIAAAARFGSLTGNRGVGNGVKAKDLVGVPWMLAFALRADGWWLRQDIIWHKPNPMPESVRDRCTKAHEYLFLFAKSERYYYDQDAVREPHNVDWSDGRRSGQTIGHVVEEGHPLARGGTGQADRDEGYRSFPNPDGRNKRSVWTVATAPFPDAHFATFPPALIEPAILAGCPEGGVVLDPFVGSGTTAMVARDLGRKAIGIDLNPEYLAMAVRRIGGQIAMVAP